eukprot:CAMPEP_0197010204 /NCGR_PEP_ID=MMETSP1380-20130617/53187_1 /TAXON_ID=5936 /ORGANISM="Euplotes crassus, Strain CT5" /LENGTH=80 /DNA_ID=CAMNT_0042431969 /DNA_START=259 /DNA_END=498 /DNA_ORIENTATION=-
MDDYDIDAPKLDKNAINAAASYNNGIQAEDIELALLKAQQIELIKEKYFQEKIRIKWCLHCRMKFPGEAALRKHEKTEEH